MKVLLALALLALVWWWITRAQNRPPPRHSHDAGTTKRKPATKEEPMVPCRACGLHVPSSEALPGELGHYCSQAHLKSSEG